MKKGVLLIVFLIAGAALWAQENSFTFSGGYVFANLEESDSNADGYRINASYEFNPAQGILSHGFTIGYIHTTASGIQNAEYKLNNVPIYYAPRLTFGTGKAKLFVKGALGTHISGYKREGGQAKLPLLIWDFMAEPELGCN